MKRLVFSILSLLTPLGFAGDPLSEMLTRMDRNAASFRGMTARLTQLKHTEVINENETETAEVKMKRSNGGIAGRVDFAGQNRRTISMREAQLQVFYPKANVVEVYDLGKYGSELDRFLLLGFSTSGKQLQRDYKVRWIGWETMNGEKAAHMELTPKTQKAKEIFRKTDLWLAEDATHPLKERIQTGDQDYMLITYSDIKLNPNMTDKDLELVLPPGVKRNTPQQ